MSAASHRVEDYLGHILDAIGRIATYTAGMDEGAFRENVLVQDAVIRNLEIIGEASRKINEQDPTFSAAHPELPLAQAYQMRNAISHGYFSVDLEIVWRTLQRDLPSLEAQIRGVRCDLPSH